MPSNQQDIKCSQEIVDYVDLIDGWYSYAKRQKYSRMSVEWGQWSAQMNRGIRQKLKEEHRESVLLRYVFTYWINRSQLLELHYKTKFKGSKKKQLAREGKRLKQVILSANAPDLTDQDMKKAVMKDIAGKK